MQMVSIHVSITLSTLSVLLFAAMLDIFLAQYQSIQSTDGPLLTKNKSKTTQEPPICYNIYSVVASSSQDWF